MSNKPISIYLLGDGGVGKSAITIRFINNLFIEEYDPTIEDTYLKNVTVDGIKKLIEVVDTAGQEEYTSMRDMWINNGDAFLLVYSIDSKSSFVHIQYIMDQITRFKGDDVPIILVGNKCDLNYRQVSTEDGSKLSNEWDVPFFETSAKENINTYNIFYEVIRNYDKKNISNKDNKRNIMGHRCSIQ